MSGSAGKQWGSTMTYCMTANSRTRKFYVMNFGYLADKIKNACNLLFYNALLVGRDGL